MKLLILGGDGMLGHQLLKDLQNHHDVRVTLRHERHAYTSYELFTSANSYYNIDVRQTDELLRVISDFKPQAIINAIGIIKQRALEKHNVLLQIEINALFPHRLDLICSASNIRLIHFSTDCVFSGKKGSYVVDDLSDAKDIYGKTKYLGEVHSLKNITLRTSIIGLELSRKTGLIEWFLAQRSTIKGYTKAIFTGVTTIEMSRIINKILLEQPNLSGVCQVASNPINKYQLLMQLKKLLNRDDIHIEADDQFICDRSLDGSAFNQTTGYQIPSWDIMLHELAEQIKTKSTNRDLLCNV